MPLWRGGPNTRTLPTVLLTPSASKAADMAHLCVPQNQALGFCRGFVPDIQICGTHGRKDLVNATIISNTEEEEEEGLKIHKGKTKYMTNYADSEDILICGRVEKGVGGRVRKMGGMACGSTMIHIVCSADRYQHSNTRWHSDWADDVSFIHVVFLLPSSPYIIQSTSTSTVFSLYSYSLHFDSQRPPSFTRTCTRKSKQSATTSIHAHCSTSLAPPDHVVTSPCTAHTAAAAVQRMDTLPLGTPLLI